MSAPTGWGYWPRVPAHRRPTMGVVGAIILAAGIIVAGVGFMEISSGTQAELNCELSANLQNCASAEQNAENQTITGTLLLGIGMLVAGLGAVIGFATLISIMARRETNLAAEPSPGPPPGGGLPPPPPLPGSPPPPAAPSAPAMDTFSYPPQSPGGR